MSNSPFMENGRFKKTDILSGFNVSYSLHLRPFLSLCLSVMPHQWVRT